MATGKITKQAVDRLAPDTHDRILWGIELRGFGIKITKTGKRVYIYQYQMGGREATTRRREIGAHCSPWTPASARTEAERLAVYVNQETDPNAAEHERRRLAVELAFESFAERFRISCGDDGWGRMVERTLRLHITPQFKRKLINAITRANIAALLDTLPPAKIALKRNTFAVIRRLFQWAINRCDLVLSPCDGMETPRAIAF